jgi:aminoglycoside phosphotransferase (APT) family kinase protein
MVKYMSDSKVYRDGDKLIKIYLSAPYEYVEQAYQRQKLVHDAGLPIPAVFGIKKINETETMLEMEYLEGKPLVHMYESKGEEASVEAMRIMVKLQCQMNAIDASGFPDLTDMYVHEITTTPYLTEELKETLLALMKSLDKGKTNLCHGDIHPHNIMYNGDKYWIIDWEDAGKGDPAADACMQLFYSMRWGAKKNNRSFEQYMQFVYQNGGDYLRLFCNEGEDYLQMFCEESGIVRDDILAWLPVIAGVQININDDADRIFIAKFVDEWYTRHCMDNSFGNGKGIFI